MVNPSIEARIREMAITLPPTPTPFGTYSEAVMSGALLFLSGMLPVLGHEPIYLGRVGSELSVREGYDAARIACMNGISAARAYLGSLDYIKRIAKLGVYIAAPEDFRDHPKVADGASDLLMELFGQALVPPRVVLGVSSIPLGMPIEVELVFEIDMQ